MKICHNCGRELDNGVKNCIRCNEEQYDDAVIFKSAPKAPPEVQLRTSKEVQPPIQTPINPPVAPPMEAPVQPPIDVAVNPPVAPPMEAPIQPPIDVAVNPPVAPPMEAPVQPPIDVAVNPPVAPPMEAPVQPPIEVPTNLPVAPPMEAPVQPPIDVAVNPPVAPPMEAPVQPPIEVAINPPVAPPMEAPVQPPIDVAVNPPVAPPMEAPVQPPIEVAINPPIVPPMEAPVQPPIEVAVNPPVAPPMEAPVQPPLENFTPPSEDTPNVVTNATDFPEVSDNTTTQEMNTDTVNVVGEGSEIDEDVLHDIIADELSKELEAKPKKTSFAVLALLLLVLVIIVLFLQPLIMDSLTPPEPAPVEYGIPNVNVPVNTTENEELEEDIIHVEIISSPYEMFFEGRLIGKKTQELHDLYIAEIGTDPDFSADIIHARTIYDNLYQVHVESDAEEVLTVISFHTEYTIPIDDVDEIIKSVETVNEIQKTFTSIGKLLISNSFGDDNLKILYNLTDKELTEDLEKEDFENILYECIFDVNNNKVTLGLQYTLAEAGDEYDVIQSVVFSTFTNSDEEDLVELEIPSNVEETEIGEIVEASSEITIDVSLDIQLDTDAEPTEGA